jgi:thiol:disulfide interchange protein DsbD
MPVNFTMPSFFHRFLNSLLAIFLVCFATSAHAQKKDSSPHSDIALISEKTSIQPGVPFWVASRLKMEPQWHSYWINPGDAGLATSLSWELPAGFKAGPIVWPHPEKISLPPLMSYGYENEVWLLTQITPPQNLSQNSVTLRAKAKWLVCKEACLPASADISLTLPVESTPAQDDTRWQSGFAKTRAAVPTTDSAWKVRAERAANGKDFVLHLQAPQNANIADGDTGEIYFFSSQNSLIEPAAPQKFERRGDEFIATIKLSEYSEDVPKNLTGILLAPKNGAWNDAGNRALAVDAPIEKTGSIAAAPASITSTAATTSSGTPTLPFALALALGGGLLLNLMPCVFPVLSLKILGFVRQAGEDKSRIKKHGFAFGAGVLLSFWALAGVLLAVRAAGIGAGWGYQLQYPPFVAALVILLFLVGLNLLGAFEIGVSLTRLGSAQAGSTPGSVHGYSGSFWSGVLATIVATPCTAPFMGSALAFALTQPAASALLVFTFLGIGMALPYMILSLNPAWIKKLPRPGAWMETFKQAMAFPIFATALWLTTVFGLQTGALGMAYLLGALLLVGAAIWLWQRWAGSTLPAVSRWSVRTAALFSLILAIGVAWSGAKLLPPAANASEVSSEAGWQSFSQEKVDAALSAGRPVFIDITAAWCITCQVNKRVALHTDEVSREFAKRNVVLMRADWTRRDAQISRALEKYGRSGVPTYVLIKSTDAKPQILPEVLSPSIVINALQDMQPRLASDTKNP